MLVTDWKSIATGAWSMRFIYLSTAIGVLDGVNTFLAAASQQIHSPYLGTAATLVTGLAGLARLLAQPKLK